MHKGKAITAGVGTALVAVALVAFTVGDPAASDTATSGDVWRAKATGARIVGGYGNNFAYDGENVRSLDGSAEIWLDPASGKGTITIEIETTDESGPIRLSSSESWTGKIRIVQQLDTEKMKMARIAQKVFLHGNTGNEAPVMPNIYNYFATWGPSKIWVNGEEVVSMIGSHTMFSERSRNAYGKIVNAAGVVYSPMGPAKEGFTDSHATEFHFVAHTTQPDKGNFPPHTAWLHLNFSEVRVLEKPADVQIPYTN